MEYALLVALIALVAIAALQTVGGNVSDEFDNIATCIDDPTLAGCETGGGAGP